MKKQKIIYSYLSDDGSRMRFTTAPVRGVDAAGCADDTRAKVIYSCGGWNERQRKYDDYSRPGLWPSCHSHTNKDPFFAASKRLYANAGSRPIGDVRLEEEGLAIRWLVGDL